MENILYTIGYSGFNITSFINTLKNNNVSVLVDVRSTPYSTHYPDYNKEQLERTLKKNRIIYRSYAKEFGAQQMDKAFYSPEGYLDFEAFVKSDAFTEGFTKLEDGMRQNYAFALMCAEKNPINCHRSIMISRVFHESGYKVIHLLPDGKKETQDDIEVNMLDKYFPNRTQMTLFDISDENSLIAEAYHMKNAEIGYRMEVQKAI